MKNKERLVRYYQGTDNGALAARLIELAEYVCKGRPYAVSDFVSPGAVQIGETVCAQDTDVHLQCDGGYEGAERVRMAFVRNGYEGAVDFSIRACRLVWDSRYRLLTHRDVLGSLMGLGVERAKFGDIIMVEDGAVLLLDANMESYVQQHLQKVSIVTVQIAPYDLKEIAPRQKKVKEIKTTVASLRLDAIVASGFGISRTKAAAAIKGERVQLNWQPIKSSSREVRVGDCISLRGKGKLEVGEITGISRKGRTGVLLKRYI